MGFVIPSRCRRWLFLQHFSILSFRIFSIDSIFFTIIILLILFHLLLFLLPFLSLLERFLIFLSLLYTQRSEIPMDVKWNSFVGYMDEELYLTIQLSDNSRVVHIPPILLIIFLFSKIFSFDLILIIFFFYIFFLSHYF